MNEKSNRSLASEGLPVGGVLAVALFGAFAQTMAGCPGPTPNGGAGGSGTTTAMPCTTAKDCPAPDTSCKVATCDGKTCGVEPAPKETQCTDDGGKLCDGDGRCVACLSPADCPAITATPCVEGVYVGPTCKDGACGPAENKDCAAEKLACKPTGCEACLVDADCRDPTPGDCTLPKCNAGVCEAVGAPQGFECAQTPTGAEGGVCNASGTCIPGTYAFVTSLDYAPSFGGTAGADEVCQKVATKAGLGGTWMSWTADSKSSPAVRFAQNAVPYRLLDDNIIAENWTKLTGAATTPLLRGIDMDEQRASQSQVQVWTGSKPWGEYVHTSCEDWTGGATTGSTGDFGIAGQTGYGWSWQGMAPCTGRAHLYCFQQPQK